MNEKFPPAGGETNQEEINALNQELEALEAERDNLNLQLSNSTDYKEEANLRSKIKTNKRAIKQKKALIKQRGGFVGEESESGDSPLTEFEKRLASLNDDSTEEENGLEGKEDILDRIRRRVTEYELEENVESIEKDVEGKSEGAIESGVEEEVVENLEDTTKKKIHFFEKAKNFKDKFTGSNEVKKAIGKAGYDTITSIWGIKTLSDLLLAFKGKGDIYEHFKQKKVRKEEMQELNDLAIEIEKNWQVRLNYERKRREAAGDKKEARDDYDSFMHEEKLDYEDASSNVKLKLKEFYTAVDASQSLTEEEKKEYRKKATRIMYERGKEAKPVDEEKDATIARATSVYLQTKVHGTKLVKDLLNTTLMSTGLVALRGLSYGLMSVVDRGASAKRQYAKDVELDYRKLRGVEVDADQESKVKAIIKDVTINATTETVSALIGRGKKKGFKGKSIEFAQAAGSILRLVGIGNMTLSEILSETGDGVFNPAFDNLLDSIEEKGVLQTLGGNLAERPAGFIKKAADIISSPFDSDVEVGDIPAEETVLGRGGLRAATLADTSQTQTFIDNPDTLLQGEKGAPVNFRSILEIDQGPIDQNDPWGLNDYDHVPENVEVEQPDNFRVDHALLMSESEKDGFEVNLEKDNASVIIKLGEDGAYKNVDQALRRLAVDNMEIQGSFDAVDAARAENVLANIRELINGKNVANMSAEDIKEMVHLDENGDLVIDDYNKFAKLNEDLFERASDPIEGITEKSDAIAYVDNTGIEKWQEIVNAKLDQEAHAVDFNMEDISAAEAKVFEEQLGEKFSFLGDEADYEITDENDALVTINDKVYEVKDGSVVSIDGNKLEQPIKVDDNFQENFIVHKIGADYNVNYDTLKALGVVGGEDFEVSNLDKKFLSVLSSKGVFANEENIKYLTNQGYNVDYFVKEGKLNTEALNLLASKGGKIEKDTMDELLKVEEALEKRVNNLVPLSSLYAVKEDFGYTFSVQDSGDVILNRNAADGSIEGIVISKGGYVGLSSSEDPLSPGNKSMVYLDERPINTYISDKDRIDRLFEDLKDKANSHVDLYSSMKAAVHEDGLLRIDMDRDYLDKGLDEVTASEAINDKKSFVKAMIGFGKENNLKTVGQKDNLGKVYEAISKSITGETNAEDITHIYPPIGNESLREYLMRVVGERELTEEELYVDHVDNSFAEPHSPLDHIETNEHVMIVDGEQVNAVSTLDGKKIIVKDVSAVLTTSNENRASVLQFEGRNVYRGVDDQGKIHYFTGDGDHGFNECKLPTDAESVDLAAVQETTSSERVISRDVAAVSAAKDLSGKDTDVNDVVKEDLKKIDQTLIDKKPDIISDDLKQLEPDDEKLNKNVVKEDLKEVDQSPNDRKTDSLSEDLNKVHESDIERTEFIKSHDEIVNDQSLLFTHIWTAIDHQEGMTQNEFISELEAYKGADLSGKEEESLKDLFDRMQEDMLDNGNVSEEQLANFSKELNTLTDIRTSLMQDGNFNGAEVGNIIIEDSADDLNDLLDKRFVRSSKLESEFVKLVQRAGLKPDESREFADYLNSNGGKFKKEDLNVILSDDNKSVDADKLTKAIYEFRNPSPELGQADMVGKDLKQVVETQEQMKSTDIISNDLKGVEETPDRPGSIEESSTRVIEQAVDETLPKVEALIIGLRDKLDGDLLAAGLKNEKSRNLVLDLIMNKFIGDDNKLTYDELVENGLVTDDYEYSQDVTRKLLEKYSDEIKEELGVDIFGAKDLTHTDVPEYTREGVNIFDGGERLEASSVEEINSFINSKGNYSKDAKQIVSKLTNLINKDLKDDPTFRGSLSGNTENYTFVIQEPRADGVKVGIRVIDENNKSMEWMSANRLKGSFRASQEEFAAAMEEAKNKIPEVAKTDIAEDILKDAEIKEDTPIVDLEKGEQKDLVADLGVASEELPNSEELSPIAESLESSIGKEYSVGKDGLDCMTLIKETGETVKNDTLTDYVEFVNTHKGDELTFTAFLEGKDLDFQNADWETVKDNIEPGEYMVSLNSPGASTYGPEGHGGILRVVENSDGTKEFTMVHASTSSLMAEGIKEPIPLHELTIKIDGKEYTGRDIVEQFKKDYGDQTKVLESGAKVYSSELASKMQLFDSKGNEIKPVTLEDGSIKLGYVTKETDLDSYFKYNKDFSKDITVLSLKDKQLV
ncbi:MAG: hypothetical protein ACKKL6_03260 [Candidatus Komeilibacteria bacterium]